MKKIKIFLSSSKELVEERQQFELQIARKNNIWLAESTWLFLDKWENMSAAMGVNGSQAEYNKAIDTCDILVLLACTKMGKYSDEEFEVAYAKFRASGCKPRIYIYYKNTDSPIEDSLQKFTEKVKSFNHFIAYFKDGNELWQQFDYELEILRADKFANMGGSTVYNELLSRKLMIAIQSYNPVAIRFLTKAGEGWETQEEVSNRGKKIIGSTYVGPLGIQVMKLMAIGKDDLPNKEKRYISKCAETARMALQLVCFSLISELWNYKKRSLEQQEPFAALAEEESAVLDDFFAREIEMNVSEYACLLNTLLAIYNKRGLQFPIPELQDTISNMNGEDGLLEACSKLGAIRAKLSKETFTLQDCFEAERYLSVTLCILKFLAGYKMISIKEIGYDSMRNNPPHYLHQCFGLGIDQSGKGDGQLWVNYDPKPVNTDAVFLYKSNYQEGINLFPFIVDLNALALEKGAKICFYGSKEFTDQTSQKILNYRFWETDDIEPIAFGDIRRLQANMNDLLEDSAKRKQLKHDLVIEQFEDARNKILG